MNRFAFAIHPLVASQRRLLGIRHRDRALLRNRHSEQVRTIGRIRVSTDLGPSEGWILGVPSLPAELLEDQAAALARQQDAAALAHALGARALGLGSVLAIAGGRGSILADTAPLPVTTGQAATAWACSALVEQVAGPGERVGILGARSTVGDAIARLLVEGRPVSAEARGKADHARFGALGVHGCDRDDLLDTCSIVVGASTTGPSLPAGALRPGTVLLDLANPRTLEPGPLPPGVVVMAGETLAWPRGGVGGGAWGRLWRLFAGYEGGLAYACLTEPLAMAVTASGTFSRGRRLDLEAVRACGATLTELGFRPRLHRRRSPP